MAGGAGARLRGGPDNNGGQSQYSGSQYGGPLQQGRGKPGSGGFDGPGEQARGPPSQSGGSQAGGPARRNPFGPGLGYDPAKPIPPPPKVVTNTRLDLPAAAYRLGSSYIFPKEEQALPVRTKLNTTGKAINVKVNQYAVLQWPEMDIYQYDITVGQDAVKMGKIKAAWNSQKVRTTLQQFIPKSHQILWDGNKIAWSDVSFPEQRMKVNFDEEKGRRVTYTAERGPDEVFVVIKPTAKVRMSVISSYISQQMKGFDASVLSAINFLDHLMRQHPSERFTMIKRSFFHRNPKDYTHTLDNTICAMKGVYASIRLCSNQPSVDKVATGLAVNVDVSNGTFWTAQDVHQAARNLCKQRNPTLEYNKFVNLLRPIKANDKWTKSEDFKHLRKMSKLKFVVKHRGQQKSETKNELTLVGFHFKTNDKGENEDAKSCRFEYFDPDLQRKMEISVYDFYVKKYHIRLDYWQLPLIDAGRDGKIPMELAVLCPNQRYSYKLDPLQTAAMIKFAVTRPQKRLESIQDGITMLNWARDPYLGYYGLKISDKMTETAARLIPAPTVEYGSGGKATPGTSGRWDLRNKKFLISNKNPFKSWGFIVVDKCVDTATVQNFAKVFIQTYVGHGGKIENKTPYIYQAPIQPREQMINQGKVDSWISQVCLIGRRETGGVVQTLPEMLFFILPGRDSWRYERYKKNMECRFGTMSQMLNVAHVKNAQSQYCSNVAMKVNAKMGGTNCKIAGSDGFFKVPTMFIGADVSHASPGSPQGSTAAMTFSYDRHGCRYAAMVATNGSRVEMITPNNIKLFLDPMLSHWMAMVGGGRLPTNIFYFRDGVSEGQYLQVLEFEVAEMKKFIHENYFAKGYSLSPVPKWTVTVCTKRHHIRFFPATGAGDKNGNPFPGTLVERDITHPFEYDFYLNAHVAIQGTSRPVHYHVLEDQIKMEPSEFQRMIYQHSYQYQRSTTPVSLFPAIYYAHLASNRARCHEDAAYSEGPRGGQKFEEKRIDDSNREQHVQTLIGQGKAPDQNLPAKAQTSAESTVEEARPLMPIGTAIDSRQTPQAAAQTLSTKLGMWYI